MPLGSTIIILLLAFSRRPPRASIYDSIVFLDETHPIDALELIAHEENWEFVRDEDNEIIITIDGGWKRYTVTAIWNVSRNLFKTSCTFEMMPPRKKLVKLYETINLVNISDIDGSFTYDNVEQLMNYDELWVYPGLLIF